MTSVNTEVILCFVCGDSPSIAFHDFYWPMVGSPVKAGFLCCGDCLQDDLKAAIYENSVEDVAAFQCFLDECLEDSQGKLDIIPVGRTHDGTIGWFNNLRVDTGATIH